MNPSETLKAKKKELRALAKIWEDKGLFNLRIFGSVARGDDDEESDIDFIVRIGKGKNGRKLGLDFFAFAGELEELLGTKVDLVSEDSCPEYLKKSIEKEAIPAW